MDLIASDLNAKVKEFVCGFVGKLREPISGFTHFIGVLLAIVGMVVLMYKGIVPYRPIHAISYFVFGVGMISLYSASTLYHWMPSDDKEKLDYLRRIDQMMIFLFIAGTYTPLCLIPLRGSVGWISFTIIWIMAIAGIFRKITGVREPLWMTYSVYLTMGWFAVMMLYPLFLTLSAWALFWLFCGGIFYTVGALIDIMEKPDPWPKLFGFHEIFHILVLLGSACHYWMIYKYITPLE